MDLLLMVVSLPRLQIDLGFNPAALTWILNAFVLAFGGLLLLGGRLGDMMGQVRAFRIGLVVFVLASLLGGLAQTPRMLVTARVLQGIVSFAVALDSSFGNMLTINSESQPSVSGAPAKHISKRT